MTPPPPHILCGGGGGEGGAALYSHLLLWKDPRGPHTRTHKSPLPVHVVFVRSHTYKAACERASSPYRCRRRRPQCERLSRRFTGSDGLEKFPVRPTTEEKNTHTSGCSASASVSSTGNPIRGAACSAKGSALSGADGTSPCVGAALLCWNSWLRTQRGLFGKAEEASLDVEEPGRRPAVKSAEGRQTCYSTNSFRHPGSFGKLWMQDESQ